MCSYKETAQQQWGNRSWTNALRSSRSLRDPNLQPFQNHCFNAILLFSSLLLSLTLWIPLLSHCLLFVLLFPLFPLFPFSTQIWDKQSLECLKILTGHTGSVLCLQYDERVIVTGSSDSTVRYDTQWFCYRRARLFIWTGTRNRITERLKMTLNSLEKVGMESDSYWVNGGGLKNYSTVVLAQSFICIH